MDMSGYDRLMARLGLDGKGSYSGLRSLGTSPRWTMPFPGSAVKSCVTALCLVVLLALGYQFSSPPDLSLPTVYSMSSSPSHYVPAKPINLHLFIPASKPDPNLCKAMMSASILGYPSPVLINWNRTFDDANLVEGGSHLAKINGTAQYLNSLDESKDEDLVLMMDGYDAWVQLRPQSLVDRFYAINVRANDRITSELGRNIANANNVSQEIVFGCQKRCWPWTSHDPPCYAVPNSSLPLDIYGPETDTFVGDGPVDSTSVTNDGNPYINFRQRFLNSGVTMGTVRALRKLFQQALAQAPQDINFGSDQYIFSHIFGDQELYREILRRDGGLVPNEAFNPDHLEEVRAKASFREDKNFEFGIGIDYGSEIGLNTVFAEDDTEWLTFDNTDELLKAQNARNIPAKKRYLHTIPKDINSTALPFSASDPSLPIDKTWSQVRLFTDVYTGISPVVIHHNAHRNGMKSLRETWWPLVWFQQHARVLLEKTRQGFEPLVAVARDQKGEVRKVYAVDGRHQGIGAIFVESGGEEGWSAFEGLCQEWDQELFRDGGVFV